MTLWERVRQLLPGGGPEHKPTEPEVEADPHQVTGRPTSDAAGDKPGTTSSGPNDTFVGRVSGEDQDVSGAPDGAEARAERDD